MGNIEFTEWLNEQVEDRGWSFRELSRRAGLSSGTMSKVMTQQIMPSWDFCLKISHALQMPPEDVFRKAGLLPTLPLEVEEEREALRILRGLPSAVRTTVMTMLRALARREGMATAPIEEPDVLSTWEDEEEREALEEFRRVPLEWREMVISQMRMYREMADTRPRLIGEEEGEEERAAAPERS